MINSIKELKKERAQKRDGVVRDEEGRAVLDMTVRDDEDFLSPYSRNACETIGEETAEFLRNSALGLSPKEELALHLYSDCIDEREQEIYPDAIRSYFHSHLSDSLRELKRNAIQSAVMFLVGIVALAVMFIGEHFGWSQIWIECIDIFAWVFVWETVDLFFLERATIRRRMKRYQAFIHMKVVFFPLSSK